MNPVVPPDSTLIIPFEKYLPTKIRARIVTIGHDYPIRAVRIGFCKMLALWKQDAHDNSASRRATGSGGFAIQKSYWGKLREEDAGASRAIMIYPYTSDCGHYEIVLWQIDVTTSYETGEVVSVGFLFDFNSVTIADLRQDEHVAHDAQTYRFNAIEL